MSPLKPRSAEQLLPTQVAAERRSRRGDTSGRTGFVRPRLRWAGHGAAQPQELRSGVTGPGCETHVCDFNPADVTVLSETWDEQSERLGE